LDCLTFEDKHNTLLRNVATRKHNGKASEDLKPNTGKRSEN